MPTLNNVTSRREAADEKKRVSQNSPSSKKGKVGEPRKAPFRGSPHTDHPHDPFRNIFGSSRLNFEF